MAATRRIMKNGVTPVNILLPITMVMEEVEEEEVAGAVTMESTCTKEKLFTSTFTRVVSTTFTST